MDIEEPIRNCRLRKMTWKLSREFEKPTAIENRSSQKLNQIRYSKKHSSLVPDGLCNIMSGYFQSKQVVFSAYFSD